MREEDDCIWIERPFVAENVGADQRRIKETLGLGKIPGNLDRLRVEMERKTNKSEARQKKRGTRLISYQFLVVMEGTGRRGKERETRKENKDGKRVEVRPEARTTEKRRGEREREGRFTRLTRGISCPLKQ